MLGNDNRLFGILETECSDENLKNFIKEIYQYSYDEPGHYREKFKELIEKYAELSNGGASDENKLSKNEELSSIEEHIN
jgi:hypothetical protein